MTKVVDDRLAFEESKRKDAARMQSDRALFDRNWELYECADKYNYSYLWSWMGVPIIQNPTDIVVMQEIIWETRPEVIIETGVARGGSVLFYASLLELLQEGEVLGIDVDIRPHNRDTISKHPMCKRVSLIEGSSVNPEMVARVRDFIAGRRRVMVVLDSNHTHEHVLEELRLYAPLVGEGQFLVVADTSVEYMALNPQRVRPWSRGNNPKSALDAYLATTDRFATDPYYNAKLLLSSSPGGYLRCIKV